MKHFILKTISLADSHLTHTQYISYISLIFIMYLHFFQKDQHFIHKYSPKLNVKGVSYLFIVTLVLWRHNFPKWYDVTQLYYTSSKTLIMPWWDSKHWYQFWFSLENKDQYGLIRHFQSFIPPTPTLPLCFTIAIHPITTYLIISPSDFIADLVIYIRGGKELGIFDKLAIGQVGCRFNR